MKKQTEKIVVSLVVVPNMRSVHSKNDDSGFFPGLVLDGPNKMEHSKLSRSATPQEAAILLLVVVVVVVVHSKLLASSIS